MSSIDRKNQIKKLKKFEENLKLTAAEVIWGCREEMAMTLDDILARRVRALYPDARVAIKMAPKVTRIMA